MADRDRDAMAQGRYLPEPKGRRTGTSLCLSGGGYRAALFHAGGLLRLNELGVLGHVTTICSVSGGSIIAALLADQIERWPTAGERIDDLHKHIIEPLEDLTQKNIRTAWVGRRLLPHNWRNDQVAVRNLERRYDRDITRGRQLADLPERPRFIFCATDMSFGSSWVFERTRVGSYQPGHTTGAPPWPLARAVAASSCFPPAFEPLQPGLPVEAYKRGDSRTRKRKDFRTLVDGMRLSDGGVYDNLGLEPVWKDHASLLVSDGGATFDFKPDLGTIGRLGRYQGVQSRQIGALRKRWLIAGYLTDELDGTYWGIGSATASYKQGAAGYPRELVEETIAEVRTDLDYFTPPERAVLLNHGYLMADAAIRTHASALISGPAAPPAPPRPDWMERDRVRSAMVNSHKRRLLGRWRWRRR